MMVCKYCESAELDKNSVLLNHAYTNTGGIYHQTRVLLYPGYNAVLKTKFIFNNYDENNTIPINYCPMCGRKLREDRNMIKNCFYFGEEENEY